MRYIGAILFCLLLAVACISPSAAPSVAEGAANLTVLHTNDTHAHLDKVANRCTLTNSLKMESAQSDILLLDAGDVFAGTPYFSLYKGQADLWFMKYLKYDAMCLGNHEFDKGPDVLQEFVSKTDFPVVCANFDFSREKSLSGLIKPWTIIERGKHRYGIFGLTSEETAEISKPGPNIAVNDHTQWARQAVEYFKKQGVNKIIALTHIGWDEDINLDGQVEDIDIIVGGHSHTVPAIYPQIVKKFSAPTVVVQAGCYNRYLGHFNVNFNADGIITQVNAGKLIAIDDSITADKTATDKLMEYKAPIDTLMKKAAGCTLVALDGEGEHTRTRETNLGNMVADAMLEKGRHVNADIALMNGGGLRSSIPAGDISIGQVYEIAPFDNYAVSVMISGKQLVASLENGVSQVEQVKGRFLQVAGLRYKWDAGAAPGKRIISAEVNTLEGFKPVEDGKTYRVVVTDYMAGGGDGYTDIQTASNQINLGYAITDLIAEYLVQHSPVNPQVEGRIIRVNGAQ